MEHGKLYAPISPVWVAPRTLDGLLHPDELFEIVEGLCELPLDWRWAKASDWPRRAFIGSDFRFARRGGFGFIVEVAAERLFIVPRGWEAPEWGLASYNLDSSRWRNLGNFEPTPGHWVFPTVDKRIPATS